MKKILISILAGSLALILISCSGMSSAQATNEMVASEIRNAIPHSEILYLRTLYKDKRRIEVKVDLYLPKTKQTRTVNLTFTPTNGTFALTPESRTELNASHQSKFPKPPPAPRPPLMPRRTDNSMPPEQLFKAVESSDKNGTVESLALGIDPNKKRTQTKSRGRGRKDIITSEDSPLGISVKSGNKEITEILLNAGANPNNEIRYVEKNLLLKRTALFFAVENDDAEAIRLLIRYGANPNFKQTAIYQGKAYDEGCSGDQTPLGIAISEKKYNAAKALLAAGAKINDMFSVYVRRGYTRHDPPVSILALAQKDVTALKLLVDAGADLNTPWIEQIGSWGHFGFTPLGIAVEAGDIGLVRQMLKLGANPNLTAKAPTRTAIFYAKTPEMAKVLLEAGADINYVFPGGGSRTGTVLDFTGDTEMREFLLTNGARSASSPKTSYH